MHFNRQNWDPGKTGLNVKQIKALVAQMAQLIPETQAKAEQLLEERDAALGHIGNQLGPDVPIRFEFD